MLRRGCSGISTQRNLHWLRACPSLMAHCHRRLRALLPLPYRHRHHHCRRRHRHHRQYLCRRHNQRFRHCRVRPGVMRTRIQWRSSAQHSPIAWAAISASRPRPRRPTYRHCRHHRHHHRRRRPGLRLRLRPPFRHYRVSPGVMLTRCQWRSSAQHSPTAWAAISVPHRHQHLRHHFCPRSRPVLHCLRCPHLPVHHQCQRRQHSLLLRRLADRRPPCPPRSRHHPVLPRCRHLRYRMGHRLQHRRHHPRRR